MILQKTVRSLSFVLIASASSVGLAQNLNTGVGADVRVGAGSAQVGAETQAGMQGGNDARLNAQQAVAVGGAKTDAGQRSGGMINDAAGATGSATGTASAGSDGITRAVEASGKNAADNGLAVAAEGKQNKVKKAKRIKRAVPDNAKTGAEASVQGSAKVIN